MREATEFRVNVGSTNAFLIGISGDLGSEEVDIAVVVKNPLWTKALKTSADPERSRHLLDSLVAAGVRPQLEKFSADSMRAFAALSGGSQALGDLLLAHPDWLALLDIERLKFPRRAQGFQQELGRLLGAALKAQDYAAALTALRRFKQRELFRIAARDLARLSNVVEITRELSDVADVCLEAVFQIVRLQFTARFGRPFHQDADWPLAADRFRRARSRQTRRAGTQL